MHSDTIYPPLRPIALKQWWQTHSQTSTSLAIKYVAQCESTNAQLYSSTQHHNTLLVTEQQTQGKGQFERTWLSQAGDLTFSIGLRLPTKQLACLSLRVGLALVQLLSQQGINAQLKWPNDVMVRDPDTKSLKKLAGILTQSQINHQNDSAWVVIGVGLNVAARSSTTKSVAQPIGLAQLSSTWTQPPAGAREVLLMQLVEQILLQTETEVQNDFAQQWNQYDVWRNQPICLTDPQDTEHHGIASGINNTGAYQLYINGALKSFYSGQLRPSKEPS